MGWPETSTEGASLLRPRAFVPEHRLSPRRGDRRTDSICWGPMGIALDMNGAPGLLTQRSGPLRASLFHMVWSLRPAVPNMGWRARTVHGATLMGKVSPWERAMSHVTSTCQQGLERHLIRAGRSLSQPGNVMRHPELWAGRSETINPACGRPKNVWSSLFLPKSMKLLEFFDFEPKKLFSVPKLLAQLWPAGRPKWPYLVYARGNRPKHGPSDARLRALFRGGGGCTARTFWTISLGTGPISRCMKRAPSAGTNSQTQRHGAGQ